MSSSRKLLSALALVLLVLDVDSASVRGCISSILRGSSSRSSSSSSGGRIIPSDTDLRGAALTNLLSSPVYLVEKMWRPKDGLEDCALDNSRFPQNLNPTRHSGVRVQLEDRSQWLIHKGRRFGNTFQTVVTDAGRMSSAWTVEETKEFCGSKTVSELIAVGGKDYGLWDANCHFAASDIMALVP